MGTVYESLQSVSTGRCRPFSQRLTHSRARNRVPAAL